MTKGFLLLVISGTDKEASVHSVNVPDAKTTIVLALTNVVPRSVGDWGGGVVLLNTRPPESSDDRIDFFHKSLEKEESGHVVDKNGRKNIFDIG